MAGHRSALDVDVDNVDLAAVLLVEALGQSDLAFDVAGEPRLEP